MKPARKPSRPSQRSAPPGKGAEPFGRRMGLLTLWLLVLAVPLLFSPTWKEQFRTIKLVASGWLALASLFFFAWEVRKADTVRWADLWNRPAVRIALPILLVATASFAATAHPLHVREGLADLWIGAAALVGWSIALERRQLERLLLGLLVPATLLALFGIVQFHGLYRPFGFVGAEYDPRLTMTSLAGNPGDLGSYLVLPCLIAQWALFRRRGWIRILAAVALAISFYAMALTQTLAALAALGLGSVLLWTLLLPRRQAALLFVGGAALALLLALAVTPLRVRIAGKVGQALSGDWNSVLTGRLDGWRAALWMFREHPWAGVGHGAYRPEYVPAIDDLLDRGVQLYPRHVLPVFANAHNEYLEAMAEWGVLALPVLAWGLWVLVAALRRVQREDGQALAWAGVVALAVLSLAYFPFRIALLAFPALLFLAWVLRGGTSREPEDAV